MDYDVDSGRNGLDSNFFNSNGRSGDGGNYADFLGIAISKKAKQKKYSNAETARLLQTYPPRDSVDGQKAVLEQLNQSKIMLEDGLKKAKSRKTKNSITGQLAAHVEYIADMQGVLAELQAAELQEAAAAAAAASAGSGGVTSSGSQTATILSGAIPGPAVTPSPVLNGDVNSQPILEGAVLTGSAVIPTAGGGAAVLPTVGVSSASPTGAEGGTTTAAGAPITPGKSKTLTYVLFGVVGIALIAFLTRKKP